MSVMCDEKTDTKSDTAGYMNRLLALLQLAQCSLGIPPWPLKPFSR